MAASTTNTISDLLCFVAFASNRVEIMPLKSMLADFYLLVDISDAKVTLLDAFDNLGDHANFKIT